MLDVFIVVLGINPKTLCKYALLLSHISSLVKKKKKKIESFAKLLDNFELLL